MIVSTGRVRHPNTTELAAHIGSGPISAADAGAIAALWQTPGGHGATFAALASGAPVQRAELVEAVFVELSGPDVTADPADAAVNIAGLRALAEWARAQTD